MIVQVRCFRYMCWAGYKYGGLSLICQDQQGRTIPSFATISIYREPILEPISDRYSSVVASHRPLQIHCTAP